MQQPYHDVLDLVCIDDDIVAPHGSVFQKGGNHARLARLIRVIGLKR